MGENNNQTAENSGLPKTNPMLIGGIAVAVLTIGVAVALGMGAWKSSDSIKLTTASSQPTSRPTVRPTATAQGESATDKVFTLEAKNFRFTPDKIKVKKGDRVKVVLNVVDMQHDFVVDELNVRTKVGKAGETVEVEFTADRAGEFEFYCSVGNHRALGMVGTLIVE